MARQAITVRLGAMAPLLAMAALIMPMASAFKAEEFKNCKDAAFCQSLRGNTSEDLVIVGESVAVEGPRVTATVANRANANATFRLVLTAYGGMVRLHINEAPEKKRYEVPDVLVQGFEKREQVWRVVKKSHTRLRLALGADVSVELRFAPAQLEVAAGGAPLLLWNARGQFIFEHRREKQEGDPEGWWGESFKSHHDSKPRGPEAISFDVSLPGVAHVYGLPQHATDLALHPTRNASGPVGEPYRLYNLDVFEYLADSPFGLYGTIPLLLAHRAGRTLGLFWLNAAEMYVDVEATPGGTDTQWIAESGVLDLFVLLGPVPADVSAQYAALTGGSALPQLFALGYHQCRWNYKDEEDVKAVDAGFDSHDIPYDVLWLDIEHTDGKRYMTWDKSYFPTPVAMQDDIASRGRKMVTIVDPHIKRDSNWPLFKEAEDKGLYVKNNDGGDFDGWCWPGSSSYLDMTSPAVRAWWAGRFGTEAYEGSTRNLYIWNDMNEPSVFNGPEITMHKDNLHFGGYEHRDVHNLYGYLYHMATADGLRRRGFEEWGADGDRPFVLSRAFFAGTQRVGAIWTGDNSAEWPHLAVSLPMLLSINLAGLSFSGADVGGFFGNPDAQLTVRWYQVAAFTPFFRGHAHLETKRREPWLFGEENTERIRKAIRQRYQLLPYLYTVFLRANGTGAPVMRPLWYDFPTEERLFGEQASFMLGDALLVAPVLQQDAESARIVLPGGGVWYDWRDGAALDASLAANQEFSLPVTMDSIPRYLRGGRVLPLRERARRSASAAAADPLTLVVALDGRGQAQGELYLDDGRSYAFQRGQYALRRLQFADGKLASTAGDHAAVQLPAPPAADYDTGVVIDRVVFLGLLGGPQGWAATLGGGGGSGAGSAARQLDAAPGPLWLREGLPEAALVVRKAGLPAGGDWTLQLERVGSAATAA